MRALTPAKLRQLVLLIAGAGGGLFLLWFLLVRTAGLKSAQIDLDTQDAQLRLDTARQRGKKGEQIKAGLDKAREKLQIAELEMAQGDPYRWIIKTFLNFKKRHPVEIANFEQPRVGEFELHPKLPYQSATFSMNGTAFFHDFGKFLADLENTFPYLRIQRIELDPASGGRPGGDADEKLSFRMDVTILAKPPEAEQQ